MRNRTEQMVGCAALVRRFAVRISDKARHGIDVLADILQILSRAMLAVHTYEMLRTLSEENLARKGLGRMDLPRAAYTVLTRES